MSFAIRRSVSLASPRFVQAQRTFVTSALRSDESITDKAKQTVDSVNKKTGQVLAKGIENLEGATEKAKQAAGAAGETAKGVAQDAQKETKETAEEAKKRAQEFRNKA